MSIGFRKSPIKIEKSTFPPVTVPLEVPKQLEESFKESKPPKELKQRKESKKEK